MTEVFVFFAILIAFTWGLRLVAQQYHATRVQASVQHAIEEYAEVTADDELVAVLAASATVSLKRSVRLKKIRFLRSAGDTAWSVTGRLNVMGSHLINKRNR